MSNFSYQLDVAYDGTSFYGFQYQSDKETVQSVICNALTKLFDSPIELLYSGRTDTGVHASKQIVVIQSKKERSLSAIVQGGNRYLPDGVIILKAAVCHSSFHPRFDAKSRQYTYVFSPDFIPFYLRHFLVPVGFIPDFNCFDRFSSAICGRHDFKCIRKAGSYENSTIRTILSCDMHKMMTKDLYDFEKLITVYQIRIHADAFLYRMVRNLVGLYFDLQMHKLSLRDINDLLSGVKNTHVQINPAPAYGLSLTNVLY